MFQICSHDKRLRCAGDIMGARVTMTFYKALIDQLILDRHLPSWRPDVAIALNAGVLGLQIVASNKLSFPSTALAASFCHLSRCCTHFCCCPTVSLIDATGLAAYNTWGPGVRALQANGIAFAFTDYTEEAGRLGVERMQSDGVPCNPDCTVNRFFQPLSLADGSNLLPSYSNGFIWTSRPQQLQQGNEGH